MKTHLFKYAFALLITLVGGIRTYAQIVLDAPTIIPTGSWPEVVRIADMNNDGLKDVIIGMNKYILYDCYNDYTMMVYIQDKDGTLKPPVCYSFYNFDLVSSPFYEQIMTLDVGDLNRDGRNDLLIGYGTRYGIFYQQADGSLGPLQGFALDDTDLVEAVRIGDVNNDGINDYVISSFNQMKIMLQDATGNFKNASITKDYVDWGRCDELEIADVNNDGRNDIICGNLDNLFIYLQNSNGEINPVKITRKLYGTCYDFAVKDLNRDNKKDIVALDAVNYTSKVKILYNNQSDSLFSHSVDIHAFDLPDCVKIADMNNDGVDEILTVHGGWCALCCYSQTSGSYSGYQLFDIPYASQYRKEGFDVGDINNDGLKDVAIADYNSGLVLLYNKTRVATGIKEAKALRCTLYPNPVEKNLYINNAPEGLERFEIYGVDGRQVSSGKIKSNSVDVSILNNGMFIIKLFDNQGSAISGSFVKRL